MTQNSLKLRPANPEDVPILEQWDREPHVIKCVTDDPETSTAFEDTDWHADITSGDPASHYVIAEIDKQPIGAMQIIDPALEQTHYWGQDFPINHRAIDIWIGERDYLGKGYGTQMMNRAIRDIFSNPEIVAIVIDPLTSNTDAQRFYRRLGFIRVERRFFDDDDCTVFELERAAWLDGK